MTATLENHITFWQELTSSFASGRTLNDALLQARSALVGTAMENIAAAVADEVKGGLTLSDALSKHETFPQSARALIRVAEVMGRMDSSAQTVLQCLREGSICPLSCAPTSGPRVRFWRLLGRLLSSGVPILQAMEILAAEAREPMLVQAASNLHRGILEGKTIADCLAASPGFGDHTVAIMSAAESAGRIDAAALELADALEKGAATDPAASSDVGADGVTVDDAAVIQQINALLRQAVSMKASDIHFDSRNGGAGHVRVRVDGVLQEAASLTKEQYSACVERVKTMCNMNVAEKRTPQDGRLVTNIGTHEIDLRVSVVPACFGERVVMRILRKESVILDLDRIGFDGPEQEVIRRLCRAPNGMVIVNGPTGSGKTTTLYAMMQQMDRAACNVITIEDPVELAFDDIAQIPVNVKSGATFPRLIRSVLRQDPDIIMVGEIRDVETAQLLVQCSLTGHLVLTTLHAATSPGAVQRLLDMGLEPFLVSSSVLAVISQYLVRCLCPHCRQPAKITPAMLPAQATEILAGKSPTFYSPKGCDKCGGGYRGRTAIHEILVMDDAIRNAVSQSAGVAAIRTAALQSGMRTLLADGLLKAAAGVTSIEEVLRVTPLGANI